MYKILQPNVEDKIISNNITKWRINSTYLLFMKNNFDEQLMNNELVYPLANNLVNNLVNNFLPTLVCNIQVAVYRVEILNADFSTVSSLIEYVTNRTE